MTPEVSVVMAVFNGAARVAASVESVLSQEGVTLELVVVNDGSTDGSMEIVEGFAARDGRVRVLHQENRGLTQALIRGCREARAPIIARQDVGDVSLAGRLVRQLQRLNGRPQETLASCWVAYAGPGGEPLFEVEPADEPAEWRRRLRTAEPRTLRGLRGIPHHGTAMFRREDYERAGGYREQFYFAQDLDLWLRLTDRGLPGCVPAVLYRGLVSPASISSRHRQAQIALTRIALELAAVRERDGDESALLARAAAVRPGRDASPPDVAGGHYFIGRCLLARQDPRAGPYLRAVVRERPLHVKAWASLCLSVWRSWRRSHGS